MGTPAEITKFNGEGLLNQPWERVVSDPGVNEWKAGAAARVSRGFQTCYFCHEPGHSKANCVKYLAWKEKREKIVCSNCNEKGHIAKWCEKEAQICTTCLKPGHGPRTCRSKKKRIDLTDEDYPELNSENQRVNQPSPSKSNDSTETVVEAETKDSDVSSSNSQDLASMDADVLDCVLNDLNKCIDQEELDFQIKSLADAAAMAAASVANGTSSSINKDNHFLNNDVGDNAEIMRAIQEEKSIQMMKNGATVQAGSSRASSKGSGSMKQKNQQKRLAPYTRKSAVQQAVQSSKKPTLTEGQRVLRPSAPNPSPAQQKKK